MDSAPDAPPASHPGDCASALLEQVQARVTETWLLNAQTHLSLAAGYLQMLRTSLVPATRLKLYGCAVSSHEAAQRGRDKVALSLLPILDPERFQTLEHGIADLSAKLADVLQYLSTLL